MKKLLQAIVDRVRCEAIAIWRALAPHVGYGVAAGAAADVVRCRHDLILENAMLRQQLIVLTRKRPHPKVTGPDRVLLLLSAAFLPGWRRALAIVQPETLLRWHRAGFRLF